MDQILNYKTTAFAQIVQIDPPVMSPFDDVIPFKRLFVRLSIGKYQTIADRGFHSTNLHKRKNLLRYCSLLVIE